jgi:spore maturation protein CgeB
MSGAPRLLLVADPGLTQMGGHLQQAAEALGLEVALCDSRRAFDGSTLARKAAWWLRGHRPVALGRFSGEVLAAVRRTRPDIVLTSGLAPIDAQTVGAIRAAGVRCLNFLTDDPWNPAHRAPWFMRAVRQYDVVFTPRRANLDQLRELGVRRVEHLAFGYNPNVHHVEEPQAAEERRRLEADVLLAGGADADRVDAVAPLIRAGFDVALYGGYWNRFGATRAQARGMLDAAGLRRATAAARVCLGLVRRANRDGHAMRTFEVPAMQGCFLVEPTVDHRALFGEDGDAVLYFATPAELVEKTAWLLAHPDERRRLARRACEIVTSGPHQYRNRLADMVACAA